MTKRVYIETTIPSYLAAWPSRDLLQTARQRITHDWWDNQRQNYDLCISQTVIDEAEAGDAEAGDAEAGDTDAAGCHALTVKRGEHVGRIGALSMVTRLSA